MKISDIELFQMLSEHELEMIARNTKIVRKNQNETIFLEGEDSKYLHILLDGKAKVYRVDDKGKELL
ncbi:MAG: cyclic nucleotide-binding domain-containing protein, partial [Sulfurovum sp.]